MSAEPVALRFRRLECKYVLDAATRADVESALRPYLRLAGHAKDGDGTYTVRSLYFDDPVWSAFHAKIDGLRSRSKFRLRTYGRSEHDPAPWFLEQKGRQDGVVWKHRAPLGRTFDPCLRGEALTAAILANVAPGAVRDRFEFAVLRQRIAPGVLVDYRRRPYSGAFAPDFRVTFDDLVTGTATDRLFGSMPAPRQLLPGSSVLEIKFAHAVPAWFHAVVQSRELQRRSISKVCSAILALGLAQAR